jgi:hypothetical protein
MIDRFKVVLFSLTFILFSLFPIFSVSQPELTINDSNDSISRTSLISLVENGDFEEPDPGFYRAYSAGETFGGWTVV